MQGKKNLEKAVVLSLLLTTMGLSQVGMAAITGGTSDFGGTISVGSSGYVNATSNVTLNATSDVNFSIPGDYQAITNQSKNGVAVTLNMNGHSLTSGQAGKVVFIDTITGGSVKVVNAYDILLSNLNDTDNLLQIHGGKNNDISLQATHDIILKNNLSRPGYVMVGTNSTGSIIAGNNIYLSGSQPVQVRYGSQATLQAGQDIYGDASSTYAFFIAADPNSKLNITAVKGKIEVTSTKALTSAVQAYGGAMVVLYAAKDINLGSDTTTRTIVSTGTVDVTSDTGTINLTANGVADNNVAIYSFPLKTSEGTYRGVSNLHSDTNITAYKRGAWADNGDITFDKAVTITAPTAIETTGTGKVTAMNAVSAKKITGNITSDGNGSSADVNFLTSDSFLTGATTVSNSGAINLEFGNSAPWNVTGTSSLTNLVNNSTVNMRYTGNSTNETITTANLSGNGTYVMNTDLQASYDSKNVQSNGDKIIITTSSSGNNVLDLRDVSLDDKIASQGYLLLVEDQSNGSATFSGKDLAHGGIFKYKPVITTANPTDYTGFNASAKNWYLTGFEKTIVVSDNTKATLGLGETRYANYFMDQDTLLKRLGELRTIKGEPEENGIWARYRHGGMDGSGFSGGSSMVQVGYDKKTANKRYTGFAFNHTSSTYDFDGGSTGEGSQDALTVYNTWLGDKNHYFDIVGKLGKMRGNSTYEDSLFPEKGNYDSWFCSISGEYGRKNIDKNGWYYEPQAQLTLGRIRGDDYTTGLGTRVNMASITSLISRAGVTFGKEYNMKNSNTHSNIYGKINWLHEFKGDANTSLRDTYGDSYDHKTENSGSWWNAGFGATINVNKNTHMYLDFEKNFGGEVTTNWIGQLGCQWTWK